MGKKVVRPNGTVYDAKTGEYAGSIGNPNDIPTPIPQRPGVLNPLLSEQPLQVDYSAFYDRYLTAPAAAGLGDAKPLDPYEDVAFALGHFITPDLDETQEADVYRMLYRNIAKKTDLPDPTDEEWASWQAWATERVNDPLLDIPDAHRDHLKEQLSAAAAGPKPSAAQFAMIKKVNTRMRLARYSLEEGYEHIAAWYDTDPAQVKEKVASFRQQYLAAARTGTPPPIDEGYAKAFRGSQLLAPKDDATLWAHQMADDPSLYEPAGNPRKYVAFDLETTSTDTQEAKILQVALIEYDENGNQLRELITHVQPPAQPDGTFFTGEPDAVQVHGILPEHVANAPTLQELEPTIRDYLNGATVVGQNVIDYDSRIISNEFNRIANGDTSRSYELYDKAADTLWYTRRHLPGLSNYKLSTVVEHLGLGGFQAHDAGADAKMTAKVFFELRSRFAHKRGSAIRQPQTV